MDNKRASNAKANEKDYLERKLVLNSLPTMLYIELTQNCNLSCKMCRSAQGYDPSRDMDNSVFDLVVKELFPYASMVDLRGWGESTILHDFDKRLRSALDSGVRVRLITNAHAMTEKLWEMFFEGDNVIGVSFDSASAEVFSRLGRGDFARVVRNLRQGAAIRAKRGRGSIYLNVVVNSLTIQELPALVRLSADIGLTKVVVNPIKTSQDQVTHLRHALNRIPNIIDEVQRAAAESGVKVQFGSALHEDLVVDYGLPTICSNPWSHALIDYKGRVGFCDHLINHPEFTFGSLKESSFESIWNGKAFQDLRAEHIQAEKQRSLSKAFWKCSWCYHNRYLDSEPSAIEAGSSREVSTSTGFPIYQIQKRVAA
jgi:radical SAM protein with 4Fe4S-binding SPASM domain